jgi:uncharacterized protein YjcR
MDRAFVAQGVANRLFATEASIDKALAEASQLMAEMVEARQTMRVSAVVGGEAVSKAAQTIAALSEARSAIVATHNELAGVKDRIGVRTKMIGILPKDTPVPSGSLDTDIREAG